MKRVANQQWGISVETIFERGMAYHHAHEDGYVATVEGGRSVPDAEWVKYDVKYNKLSKVPAHGATV